MVFQAAGLQSVFLIGPGPGAQGRVIFVFVQKSTSELGLPRSTIHVHTITTRGTINPAPHWLLAWPHASQKIIEKYLINYLSGLFITRIEDAGIAICHLRGYIISIQQGPEMDLRRVTRCVHRQGIIKMYQFRPNITKIMVSTFWRPGKSTRSRRRPMPACSLVSFKHPRPFFRNISRWRPNLRKQYQTYIWFGPLWGWLPKSKRLNFQA